MSLAALLWAAFLALAAVSKLGDMPGSMLRAMRDLGLPAFVMRPAYAHAHLGAQLVLAVGLVATPAPLSWIITISAACLAGLYLIIVSSRRGFTCRCVSDRPHTITGVTVLRNILFVVLALLAVGSDGIGGLSASDWPAAVIAVGAAACDIAGRRAGRG